MVENSHTTPRGFLEAYWHFFPFTALYSLLGCICIVSIDATWGYSMSFGMPLIIASLVIIASWTVFGPSKYWISFLAGQVFGFTIAFGCVCGFYIAFGREFDNEILTIMLAGISVVPTATVAAQIPLWIFRGFFGWRFTFRSALTTASLSLRDLFVITFVFGIALTAPQYSASYFAEKSIGHLRAGIETHVQVVQPDGTIGFETTEVNAANVERLRDEAKAQFVVMFYQMAIGYSAMVAVVALLTVPLIWFVFRIQNRVLSYFLILGYGALFFIIVGAVASFTNGMPFFLYGLSFWTAVVISCSIIFFASPLVVARFCGFRLTIPKDRMPTAI